ncbi:hypothetical protein CRENBAI_003100 [Crenichthys baileyi]|uniref:Uncharacterized protein n=1 Tax=Crenichthys baileyi TaxID=28760 RepID=A0AAV9R2V2_9TELE
MHSEAEQLIHQEVPDPASLLAERLHYRTRTKLNSGSSLLLAVRPSQPPGQLSRTLSTLRRRVDRRSPAKPPLGLDSVAISLGD